MPQKSEIMEKRSENRRFSGLINLYGSQGLSNLQTAHVVVIGIGGVGSWAVEALARNAIGHITMIDMDVVSESNINRQLPALQSTLGMDKAQVLKSRIREINPDCKVSIIDDFVTVKNVQTTLPEKSDYVLDCIDNFRVKAAIIAHCRQNKISVITVGGAGGQMDPLRIKQMDLSRTEHDALFAKTRKLLRQDYHFPRNPKRTFGIPCVYSDEQVIYSDGKGGLTKEKPELNTSGLSCAGGLGSSMQVTSAFAMVAVARVVRDIVQT